MIYQTCQFLLSSENRNIVLSCRLLSAQRDQLETTVSNSSREVERMSQNVEELQWRIRNNYELPVEICSPTSQRPTQLRFDRQVVTGLKVMIDGVLTTQANKLRNG